jgi:serine/threonine protein kinase/Tol biopolymer transport system component
VSIVPGTRFGPYEIVTLIGAGGMGEVYRARDTRLGRDVAVKILPSGFASDPERLRRFELEARAASQLSHHGILTVHDIGTSDGQPYIVSELLEGENLRERLTRGPLAPRRSIEIAAAIADALAAAHARGIVHRDLKPENLFLTRDGRVKILDFGIAKLTAPDTSEGPAGAATATIHTDVGVAVGTLGYMAPEQLRGQPVDHRADIFALGAILHEMIGGAPAFRRDSRIQTVNAVLEADPPELDPQVSPGIRRIIGRCLEKTPEARFQSARDLAFALTTLSESTAAPAGTARQRAATQMVSWWTAAGLALGAAVLAVLATTLATSPRGEQAPSRPGLKRFTFQPSVPPNDTFAVSPDGTRLVYSVGLSGGLFQRLLNEYDAKPIPGSEGGRVPFFSPDGQWIAFAVDSKIKKVSVNGGAPITIADTAIETPLVMQGHWGADGTIVVAQRELGLMSVPAEGGSLRPVTTPDKSKGVIDHHSPFQLPGGALLFTLHMGPELFNIAVRTPGGDERLLLEDAYHARYLSSGHLVYGKPEGLYAAPFDLTRLELAGPPVLVVEGVRMELIDGTIEYDVAVDGTLIYQTAEALGGRRLVWFDRQGQMEPLPAPAAAYEYPKLSPDGSRVAVQIADGVRHDIWIYEFATDSLTKITTDGTSARPLWTPDGKRIAYATRRPDGRHIVWQPLDGTAAATTLVSGYNPTYPGVWTPDGERLIYVEDPPTSFTSLKMLRVGVSAPPEGLLAAPPAYGSPQLSPDGRWLAYIAWMGNRPQVFVRPLAGGAPRQVTPDGGGLPRWSADGTEIFIDRRGILMRLPIRTRPTPQTGRLEPLFDRGRQLAAGDYDVTADGKRFLMVKRAEGEASVSFHIVLNWLEELKQRVPLQR